MKSWKLGRSFFTQSAQSAKIKPEKRFGGAAKFLLNCLGHIA
jgi:hypothetical protein